LGSRGVYTLAASETSFVNADRTFNLRVSALSQLYFF
jgi:hypothetical protein